MKVKGLFILLCCFINLGFGQEPVKLIDSIFNETKKIRSDSLKAQYYYGQSTNALQKLGDLELSKRFVDSAMHYSMVSSFKDSEAKCHFMYGLLARVNGNYDKALDHFSINIDYFKNDSINKAYALYQVAIVNKNLNDFENALSTYTEILAIFSHKKDSFAMASTINSIANIYGEMKEYDLAIENFSNANQIFLSKNKKRDLALGYRNISEIYLRKNDTIVGRNFAEKSLKLSKEINEDFAKGNSLFLLGRTYSNQNFEKTYRYYNEAEPLLEKVGHKKTLALFYNNFGDYYYLNKNYLEAKQYYNKVLNLYNSDTYNYIVKDAYKGLSNVFKSQQQYSNAYKYQTKYVLVKDSLENETRFKNVRLLQNKFETEKKDKEIAEQQLQLQQNQNKLQYQNSRMNYLYGLLAFALLSASLAWYVYIQRQKRKDKEIENLKKEHQIKSLEFLIEGEEKERQRLAKELHDGVNGDLSAIKFKLSTLLEMNNKIIKEAITMIDDSCSQVRAISHNLVPPSLENFNLIESIRFYCENLNAIESVDINYQHLGNKPQLFKNEAINVYRIIQELVSNSLKHSKATEINVQTSYRSHFLQFSVEDNGIGFVEKEVEGNGIGLQNLKNRVAYLNAKLDFISSENGTSFTIDFETENIK